MNQPLVITFVLLLLIASAFSAHYKYHLESDALFMYMVIATIVAFLCTMCVILMMALCFQIQKLITHCQQPLEPVEPPVETISPAQEAVLRILERLTLQMIENATLPTYTAACRRTSSENTDSPPPYMTIVIPPPAYMTVTGQQTCLSPITTCENPTLSPPRYSLHE